MITLAAGRKSHERLTICHVVSGDLWAGAEVVIFNLLSSLREATDPRITVLSLNEGVLTDRLRAAGIVTHVIPEGRHSLFGILRRAARLLRHSRIDIVHAHGYKQNVLAWLLARRLGVTEVLTTIHGLPEPATNSWRERMIVRGRTRVDYFIAKRVCARAVAVSRDMKRSLVDRYGFHEDHVTVIRNGARLPPPTSGERGRSESFHIGTVGRMVPIKGFDLFLDVASALKREGRPVRFSILGDGPLREDLSRRAADLQLEDCVDFLAPRPDPFSYYRSLDLYLNTSLHEGLPMSVVEAMACGTPVVSAAVGGIPEIVAHGEHGFLVEGRNPAVFAESCLRLMRDDALRRVMGERASATAHAHWGASAMVAGYRQLYDECGSRIRDRRGRTRLRERLIRGLKDHGRRLVERLDRRRATSLRRSPARLVRALGRAHSVLVLCQGNVIRSALAARLLAAAVEGRRDVSIRSAGLATQAGWRLGRSWVSPPPEFAVFLLD
jgi:glycosyltransferase involved in cell wall biosynthesis